ncbi:MAG: hypothetical protein M3355_02485 [Actinomycetota bacterium]|nr:hypothetical protein [Actinomycetota bacterium]
MSAAVKAAPALLIALVGAGLAYLWFEGGRAWPLLAVLALVVVGMVADRIGRSKVKGKNPAGAMVWLELWVLVPIALAALAVAFGIWVAVEFEPGKSTVVEDKKLQAAIVAAIVAFMTAVFVKSAEDVDGNLLAPRIRALFQEQLRAALQAKNPAGQPSQAELALESELWQGRGWGRSDRRKRAEAIAAGLA